MTRSQRRAGMLRWSMLVVGVLLFAGALVYMLAAYWDWTPGTLWTPLSPTIMMMTEAFAPSGNSEVFYAVDIALWIGVFLLMQWMFLRPRKHWRVRLTKHGRPMKSSVIAAAFIAMLISAGLLATLLELPEWWGWIIEPRPPRSDHDGPDFGPVWIAMGVMWVIWGVVFLAYWRGGDRFTQLSRMTRALLAGSVLQVFIGAAVFVWDPRQQRDCYCARGSYTGLVFGGTALIWCFGPAVALLFMRERYRAAAQHCAACGYDLQGTIAAGKTVCPECGEKVAGAEPKKPGRDGPAI